MDYFIYFAITIGILVFVQEFGHFAAAKLCNMRADVFAIGFGKRLFGYNKLTGFTFGDLPKDFDGQGNTDYRLCLLPLGGYVKIAGMVDESFDTEFADKEPQPYEFRAKPVWQKVIVISAGVIMNLLLSLLIFSGANFFQGKQIVRTTTIGYVEPSSPADSIGFKADDKIISVNGKPISNWDEIRVEFFVHTIGEDLKVKIERDKEIFQLDIPRAKMPKDENEGMFLIPVGIKTIINSVADNSPANKAGIKTGDILLEINNITLRTVSQTKELIKNNANVETPVTLLRGSDTLNLSVMPGMDSTIGVALGQSFGGLVEYKTYGFFESFYYGWMDIVSMTNLTFNVIGKVFRGNVEFGQAFGGPITIAKYAAQTADFGLLSFLKFLAMLSLSLAIINIMPFPVLDGGHLIIILIEGILKREIPIKIKVAIQNTGFVLLLLLMAFIIYSDILRL